MKNQVRELGKYFQKASGEVLKECQAYGLTCGYLVHSSQEREKHLGTFYVHVRLMVLELASLEKKKEERRKKKERKKEDDDFRSSFSRLL